jgi:hypothetical protein
MKLTGENRSTGGKPVPVPLCPPQTPRGLTWDRTRVYRGERPANNCLSHDTVLYTVLQFDIVKDHAIGLSPFRSVVFNLGYAYPWRYAKTSYGVRKIKKR